MGAAVLIVRNWSKLVRLNPDPAPSQAHPEQIGPHYQQIAIHTICTSRPRRSDTSLAHYDRSTMPRADRRRLPWRPALIDGDRPAPHVALDADLVTQLGWDLVLAIAANGGKGSVRDSGPGRHPSTLERWPQPPRRRRPRAGQRALIRLGGIGPWRSPTGSVARTRLTRHTVRRSPR